jgi:hypothetical protein
MNLIILGRISTGYLFSDKRVVRTYGENIRHGFVDIW